MSRRTRYRTIVEENIALYMARVAKEYNTHFQMALGDNFYVHGIKDEFDKRFRDTFEDVFKSEYLQTPWFLLMGNHDHYGNASGQIAYTSHSKRWYIHRESEYLISFFIITLLFLL